MSVLSHITLSVPSRLDHLDLLQSVAEELARLCGFGEDARMDLGLAVREGAINAMKHAHALNPTMAVDVDMEARAGEVRISIVDHGPGFNPDEQPDPTAPENLLRSCGRGMFLIKSLVDEMRYRALAQGMELSIVKRDHTARAAEGGA